MTFWTRFRGAALACGLLACMTAGASASTAPLDELVEVGRGDMRWFGIDLYEARLLNRDGRYPPADDTGPLALEIVYRRNISSERLVSTTEREWRRLGPELGLEGDSRVAGWLETLADIWPDVTPGDRILALREAQGPTRFYGNDGLLGIVEDPAFGPAFLGIWLHPDTRASELRAALIGAER
jgi:hypothetical protein